MSAVRVNSVSTIVPSSSQSVFTPSLLAPQQNLYPVSITPISATMTPVPPPNEVLSLAPSNSSDALQDISSLVPSNTGSLVSSSTSNVQQPVVIQNRDGSQTVVVPNKDGTSSTVTIPSKAEPVVIPNGDGSQTVIVPNKDGSKSVFTVPAKEEVKPVVIPGNNGTQTVIVSNRDGSKSVVMIPTNEDVKPIVIPNNNGSQTVIVPNRDGSNSVLNVPNNTPQVVVQPQVPAFLSAPTPAQTILSAPVIPMNNVPQVVLSNSTPILSAPVRPGAGVSAPTETITREVVTSPQGVSQVVTTKTTSTPVVTPMVEAPLSGDYVVLYKSPNGGISRMIHLGPLNPALVATANEILALMSARLQAILSGQAEKEAYADPNFTARPGIRRGSYELVNISIAPATYERLVSWTQDQVILYLLKPFDYATGEALGLPRIPVQFRPFLYPRYH